MKVAVRLFAAVRQAAGKDLLHLELPGGVTIAELRRALVRDIPQASGLIERAMFAIDARYAADGDTIPAEADVACIPPVSGG